MGKYLVEIKETLTRIITVEASSKAEAKKKVVGLYRNEMIVLDAKDYCGTEIQVAEIEQ